MKELQSRHLFTIAMELPPVLELGATPAGTRRVFTVSDGRASVQVTYGSDLPGGFKAGASVEAQGTYNGGVFTANSLTAKCPTKYQAGTTRTKATSN